MSLTIQDLEKAQQQLPDYRMELVHGEVIVMSPSGLESDEIAVEICAQMRNWVRPRKLGRVAGSSAGYVLPNADADVRAPDASFIRADRLKKTTRKFAQLVPDLMFEVASATDSLESLRNKIREFLKLGAVVGILVDPRIQTVEIYRAEQEPLILRNGDALTVPDVIPDWEMSIDSIWAPEFE